MEPVGAAIGQREERLSGPVHVRSMVDTQNVNLSGLIVILVDHPVGSSTSYPQPSQLAAERVADLARLFDQGTEHELHDRGGRFLGQPGKGSIHRGGDDQLPASLGHRSPRYRALSSSALRPFPVAISWRACSISRIA